MRSVLLFVCDCPISRARDADNGSIFSVLLPFCYPFVYTASAGLDELYATVNLSGYRPIWGRYDGKRVVIDTVR